MISAGTDGVDHINIFSRGNTELGRLLSNFANIPIDLGEEGKFQSIEGYWYFLGCGDERLRLVSGYAAKKLGRSIPKTIFLSEEDFRKKILRALLVKTNSSHRLRSLLANSTLPLAHYYVFNGYKVDAGFDWLVDAWTQIRAALKNSGWY